MKSLPYRLNDIRVKTGRCRTRTDRASRQHPLLSKVNTNLAWGMFIHGKKRSDEIATALGVTEAAVSNSLARMREQLRLEQSLRQIEW